MTEPFVRAIAQLAERGEARGADRVWEDALAAGGPARRRRLSLAIAASFVALVLVGSILAVRARSSDLVGVAPVVPTDPVHMLLAGSRFDVESVSVNGTTSAPDQRVTASFDADFVRIVLACGSFTETGYHLEDGRFTPGSDPWSVVSGNGSGPESCRSDSVGLIAEAVRQGSFERQGDLLVLRPASNLTASVTLRRIGPTATPPLLGTRWWLWRASRLSTTSSTGCGRTGDQPCTGLEVQFGDPGMSDDQPSMRLAPSDATIVDLPCASGPVTASWDGDRVSLGAPTATADPSCAEANTGVNHWLVDALPGAFDVRFDGQHLTLVADDGTALYFHTDAS